MKRKKQIDQPRKMSEIMKEMLEVLLRNPKAVPSSEASHVAMFFANVAWNECVGLGAEREACRNVWQTIEAENPDLWDELKSKDIDAMIDELVEYKMAHFPDDWRRILTCGSTPQGTIRVEWLPPAAPGVDAKQEMQLTEWMANRETAIELPMLDEFRKTLRKPFPKRREGVHFRSPDLMGEDM